MIKHGSILEWLGCGVATVLTAVQTEHVFQIISLVLTCVATLVTIAFNIYKWYVKAKEDGKITKEELDELGNIVVNGAEEVKEQTESVKKEVSQIEKKE